MVFKLYPERPEQMQVQRGRRQTRREDMVLTHDSATGAGFAANQEPVPSGDGQQRAQQPAGVQKVQQIRVGPKTGRNDPMRQRQEVQKLPRWLIE